MAISPQGEVPDTGIPARIASQLTIDEQHDWHRGLLRRNRITRRNFLAASAVGAAAIAVANPFGARAYAQGASVIVGGRHVSYGADPSSQLRFAAQLSGNPSATRVVLEHGPTPLLGATTDAEIRNLLSYVPQSSGGILAAEQFYVHAAVDGIAAKTPHFYRWRTSDGFVSDVRSAWTALPKGPSLPFRFTMMGDQGADETPSAPPGLQPGDYDDLYYKADNDPTVRHAANVLNQIVAQRPDFHVLAGDIAYADPSGAGKPLQFVPSGGKATKGFDKYNPYVWDTYFAQIEASAASVPWMFATGNHDMEALYGDHGYGGHHARLDLIDNGPKGCPSAYSFVYGNVAVLSLDANDVSFEIKANAGYSGGEQNSWVERTLRTYRDDPCVDFIVCFFHHCAYSTTDSHASDGGVRAAWTALFDRYEVDLVLQGHNHIFERSDPIRAGRPTREAPDGSTVYPETDGTVYYTVGGGGRPRYGFQPGSAETYRGNEVEDPAVPNSYVWDAGGNKITEAAPWSRVRFRNYSFIAVDACPGIPGIRPSELTVKAIDEYGTEFDRLVLSRTISLGLAL